MAAPTSQAYGELQQAYNHYNRTLFDGQLPACLITMQREKRTYGYFSAQRFVHRDAGNTIDEIAMNPAYFAVIPLVEVLQTLVHEMVHLWQHHFGNPGRRGYHNREWADKMESIGLMPSSTGRPGGNRTGESMMDYPIENGPFLLATRKLLDGQFTVSWLDRFPMAVATHADAPAHANTHLAEVLQPKLLLPQAPNRSNRIKYRCPACAAQVWGKPGLKVLCGGADCGQPAMEIE